MSIRKYFLWWSFGISLLASIDFVAAQINPFNSSGRELGGANSSNRDARTQEDFEAALDTFGVYVFKALSPNEEISFKDSTLQGHFPQYHPARKQSNDWLHNGHLGAPARAVAYEPINRKGFDIGIHPYDLYLTYLDDIPFYRLEKPFTNASYYVLGDQADNFFDVAFSRNFANGVNFSLDHQRLNTFSTQNQYPNQRTRVITLGAGLWIEAPSGKYEAFLSYASNVVEQENNGGVSVPPQTTGDFNTSNSAVTFLDDGQTSHRHQELGYTHYLKFGGKEDSIKGPRRAFTVGHQLAYRSSELKYFDPSTNNRFSLDSSYYQRLFTDDRGVRHFIGHQRISNTVSLGTFRKQKSRGLPDKDYLEVALNHQYHLLDLEIGDSTLNNLFLSGILRFNPNERLNFETYAHLGLWDNAGDYRLRGRLVLDMKSIGQLELEAINQLNRPSFIEHRLIVAQRTVWNNDFSSTLHTMLSGTFRIPKWKFSVNARYHLVNNAIYYNQQSEVTQAGKPLSVLQFIIQKDFTVGKLHLDNQVTIQQATESFVRLPDFYSSHSLYYHGKWFGVLNVRMGFDLRLNSSYNPYGYQPLIGQFILQDDFEVDWYPVIDPYFSMRVERFRAFAKWENLINTAQPTRLYYQTAYYPYWVSGLRLGINWRFLN